MNQTPYGPPPAGGFGGAPPPPGPLPPAPMAPPYPRPQTGLAVASLVCGIVALPTTCCCSVLSLPLGVAASVMGAIAITRAKSEPHLYGGKGTAIAGLACGVVAVVFGILALALGMSKVLIDRYQQYTL